jgi:hypothetical protein
MPSGGRRAKLTYGVERTAGDEAEDGGSDRDAIEAPAAAALAATGVGADVIPGEAVTDDADVGADPIDSAGGRFDAGGTRMMPFSRGDAFTAPPAGDCEAIDPFALAAAVAASTNLLNEPERARVGP